MKDRQVNLQEIFPESDETAKNHETISSTAFNGRAIEISSH